MEIIIIYPVVCNQTMFVWCWRWHSQSVPAYVLCAYIFGKHQELTASSEKTLQ